MKQNKKLLALLLVLVIAFTSLALVACNKDKGKEPGNKNEGKESGWYISAGQGMGACLNIANEKNAYVLTDKATFLSYKNDPKGDKVPNLKILKEADNDLKNTYSMIAVKPDAPFVNSVTGEKLPAGKVIINTAAADVFINWMTSEKARNLIAEYGRTKYGASLFTLIDEKEYKAEAPAEATASADDDRTAIRISTTTSVNDSGLMQYLHEEFKKDNATYKWEISSAGTGAAINAAKYGNADVILVHSKKAETEFVKEGFARVVEGFKEERISFMYNFFVVVGPKTDPAKVESAATVKDAFKSIADGKHLFVSRGDKSGTHNKEVTLWPSGTLKKDGSNDVKDIPESIIYKG